MQADERSAELDHDPGIGRQIAFADNAADGALATDQNGLDVAPVLVGHQIGGETGAAGEVHDLDAIAGIVKQAVGVRFLLRQMRRDQRKVGGIEPP